MDDEYIILNSLKTQIKEHFGDKYLYETAESADDAWEVIEDLVENGVELLIIVSDWLMPGVKGDEFLVSVHHRYPQIAKVLLTGHADEQAILHAKSEANLLRCLYKPWTKEELIETIVTGLEVRMP